MSIYIVRDHSDLLIFLKSAKLELSSDFVVRTQEEIHFDAYMVIMAVTWWTLKIHVWLFIYWKIALPFDLFLISEAHTSH